MAYTDFKSYLQANYINILEQEISAFVNQSHDGMGFHSINVLSLCKQKVENVEIKTLICHDDVGPLIKIEINLLADIVLLGLGTEKYEADRKTRWFTITVQAKLKNGLHDMMVLDTEEYFGGKFDKEDALDEYLIPYIYAEDLEDIADDFTAFYCQNAIYDMWCFPVDHLLQEMGIDFYQADLPDDEFGRMYFRKSTEIVDERFFIHAYMIERNPSKRNFDQERCSSVKNAPLWGNWVAHSIR
ncbi:hypothetical protein [Selenomonas sp. oral taxon 137]|uniref:hypothetical protein n=1 Tax=Selenomonas sp. oral taxon 137 TaxID=712531 RepID=UPI00055BE4C7|nr:hypothetical protein [Selenomonas sp. oral taxon 137]